MWRGPFRDDITGGQVEIPSIKLMFPGFDSDLEIVGIIAFLKQFAADERINQQDLRVFAAAATLELRHGVIDNSHEQDDKMK